jgi:hypothetical protein
MSPSNTDGRMAMTISAALLARGCAAYFGLRTASL